MSRHGPFAGLGGPLCCAVAVGLVAGGCRGQTGDSPPILLERNMYDCERYNPESFSRFFSDGRTMREPVAGTVAADRYIYDRTVATGLTEDEAGYAPTIPDSIVQGFRGPSTMLERGKDRYRIYCSLCHGLTGDGKGPVGCKRDHPGDPCESYGFAPLPSYQEERIRHMTDGQMFATITHGVRTMPAYAGQIPARDRWAIVGYVRALQLHDLGEVPPLPGEPKR